MQPQNCWKIPERLVLIGISIISIYSKSVSQDIASPDSVAVEFFRASIVDNTIRLDWRTTREINNYYFRVERSMGNPDNFLALEGNIFGHGTTAEPNSYSYFDTHPVRDTLWYRLLQTDLNQTTRVIDTTKIVYQTPEVETLLSTFRFYIDCQNGCALVCVIPVAQRIRIRLYNILGQELLKMVDSFFPAGTFRFALSNLYNHSTSTYFYRMFAGEFSATIRVNFVK